MIAENLEAVKKKVEEAAGKAGRDPSEISIIAVSKRKSVAAILEAFDAGQRDFGENYVQEAEEKIDFLRQALGDRYSELRFHLTGSLQSNKAKRAVEAFKIIQSVDRVSLVRELAKAAKAQSVPQRVLIQVNISQEAQKGGVEPDDLDDLCSKVIEHSELQLCGLMGIGTWFQAGTNQEQRRAEFRLLATLRQKIEQVFSLKLPELSMGMSADFDLAIAEGATMVRIGTAIFGARE